MLGARILPSFWSMPGIFYQFTLAKRLGLTFRNERKTRLPSEARGKDGKLAPIHLPKRQMLLTMCSQVPAADSGKLGFPDGNLSQYTLMCP